MTQIPAILKKQHNFFLEKHVNVAEQKVYQHTFFTKRKKTKNVSYTQNRNLESIFDRVVVLQTTKKIPKKETKNDKDAIFFILRKG